MALQAALPPSDSNEFRRTALLRRLAEAQSRADARSSPKTRSRSSRSWDPAEFLGVSPYVMMGICAQVGAALGLLVFSTYQIAAQARPPAALPQAVAIQAPAEETADDQFVTVAALSAPAQAVDDYYFFLRQGMFDQAWALTDEGFREAYYPAGFETYRESWSAAEAIEVLSIDLVWQDASEAHLLGEIQEGASGLRWRNSYVLRFDPATQTWELHAVSAAG